MISYLKIEHGTGDIGQWQNSFVECMFSMLASLGTFPQALQKKKKEHPHTYTHIYCMCVHTRANWGFGGDKQKKGKWEDHLYLIEIW